MAIPNIDEAQPQDMECALGLELNVLISGGDQRIRMALARRIYEANNIRRPHPLVYVRPAKDTPVLVALPSPSNRCTLLIEEVGALSLVDQVELRRLLTQNPTRVIATTARDLFTAPHFDHELFYRLNTIHLVLSHASGFTA
jgi:hypothetical protein